jgi:hypothetical protein
MSEPTDVDNDPAVPSRRRFNRNMVVGDPRPDVKNPAFMTNC